MRRSPAQEEFPMKSTWRLIWVTVFFSLMCTAAAAFLTLRAAAQEGVYEAEPAVAPDPEQSADNGTQILAPYRTLAVEYPVLPLVAAEKIRLPSEGSQLVNSGQSCRWDFIGHDERIYVVSADGEHMQVRVRNASAGFHAGG